MPVKSISPKQRWLKANATNTLNQPSQTAMWVTITDQPLFQEAVERALAQVAANYVATDIQTAALVGLKLQGAKDFAYTLLNLGEPEKPQTASRMDPPPLDPIK